MNVENQLYSATTKIINVTNKYKRSL